MEGDRQSVQSVQTVRVACTCGHERIVANMDRTVECDCGRVYAVTVSEILSPEDRSPTDGRWTQRQPGP